MKVTKSHYEIDGVKYNRVTSVLGYFTNPGLVAWRDRVGAKQAKQTMKTAAAIGTRVHGLCHKHWEKGRYSLTPNDSVSVRNCMRAYDDWWKAYNPKTLSMEVTQHCPALGVAGTYDIETHDTLIDIKTSAMIKPEYWLQLGMYNYMLEEPKDKIAVLRLDKFTADYEYVVKECTPDYIRIFMGLLNYYRYEKGEVS